MIKRSKLALISLTCLLCFALTPNTKQEPKLIVYGSDACHYCIDTKTFLKQNNITFIYYDIDLNKDKEQEMLLKLNRAGISIDNFQLPVVDKSEVILTNGSNFIAFLKKLLE